jgi:hypothetical protein
MMVRGSDGITSHFLKNQQSVDPSVKVGGVTKRMNILVDAHSLQLNVLIVEEKSLVLITSYIPYAERYPQVVVKMLSAINLHVDHV